MKYDIFISYRRTTGKSIARMLKESLQKREYNVFLDYDDLVDGHFDSRIFEAIESAPIFMLILSNGCLDKCIMDDDWVRQEIEFALDKSKHIIPINPDKQFSEFPLDIPDFIKKGIGQHQFSVLDTEQLYNESLEKIIRERIIPVLKGDNSIELSKRKSPVKEDAPKNKDVLICVDETSVVFVNNEKIGKVKRDKCRKLSLPLGKAVSITLESLEKKEIPIHIDYTASESSDDIRISFSEHRKRISEEKKNQRLKQKKARESLKSLRSNYERFDLESFNGMTLVYNCGYYGYLNEQGMETIPCIFEGATRFNEGVACVKENGNWRFIDTNGLDVFQQKFDERSYFLDGYAIVCKGGKYGLINKKGDIKIDFLFESLIYPSDNLLLFAKKGDKYFVIDTDGNSVNPIPYDEVMVHQNCEDSWDITNKFIQIGLDGENIIKTILPCFVKQRGLVGRLSSEGKMIIPCFAQSFEIGHEKCIVKAHDKYGLINILNGRIVLPIKYSFLFPFDAPCRPLYYAALEGEIDNYIPDSYFYFLLHKSSIFQNTFMDGNFIDTESMGVIDEEGHECIPLEYNAVFALTYHGLDPIMLGLKNNCSDKDLSMAFLQDGKRGIEWLMDDLYNDNSTKQDYFIDVFYEGEIQNRKRYNFTQLVEEIDFKSNYEPWLRELLLGDGNFAGYYDDMGIYYSNKGEYEKALEYCQKALKIRKKVYGEEHPGTVSSYNNMGMFYFKLGEFDKALEYGLKALKIQKKVFGEEHADTATSYDNIGIVYNNIGEYGKALEYHLKAHEIRRKVLGEEHEDTATSYNDVGDDYYFLGDYDNALEYQLKALEIRREVVGEEHADTATSYDNVGLDYYSLGNYDKALEYHQKALEIRRKVLGEEHADTATSYNNVGNDYYCLGDYDKALEYHLKALEIRREVLGEEHEDTAMSYNNIGFVYTGLGDYDKALEYYSKELAIRVKIYGEEHPDTIETKELIESIKEKMNNHQ